ncbi:hypothetical protein MMC20_007910 [Loxospora ochrophaea]|nr:hypothetical protein [Loxospora ochrophaea]
MVSLPAFLDEFASTYLNKSQHDKQAPNKPLSPPEVVHWRSFMIDDFSPLEYSWYWNFDRSPPKIRDSVEPISIFAGTENDPYNRLMIRNLIGHLDIERPGTNWNWFNQLSNEFYDQSTRTTIPYSTEAGRLKSCSPSVMMAFELQIGAIKTKAYFMQAKAEQLRLSRLIVLTNGIRNLEKDGLIFPAYDTLLEFFSNLPHGLKLEFVGIAIDCMQPHKSQLKLYMRSRETSFDSVCTILSMDQRNDALTAGLREELKELWYSVMGLDPSHATNEALRPKEHKASGVLYYFDIKTENAVPETKVYIPVRHYAKNDLQIAQRLASYLQKRQRDTYIDKYMNALKGLCTHRPLNSDCGLHTYISAAIHKNRLALTSYLGPEIYHRARWQ